HLTDINLLVVIQRGGVKLAEQLTDLWRCEFFVRELSEQRHLIGAKRRTFVRHVSALVPTKHASGGIEEAFIAIESNERIISICCVHNGPSAEILSIRGLFLNFF